MVSRRFVQLLIAILLPASGVVWADGGLALTDSPNSGHWLLAKYDVNGDSVISADEIAYKRERVFERMDVDADGAVSLNEYQRVDARRREALLQARFHKLDLDGDGRLTAAEYSSYLGSFDRFDSNGDGYLTQDEISVSKQNEERELTTDHPMTTASDNQDTHCLLWLCVRTSF